MFERIHVIVNPAAGQDRPVLNILNRAFHPAGIDWEVRVTKRAGDARRYAQEAVAAGVDAVAVYGGDGTIMEVASGLLGSDLPLAIFPGGTANVLSVELGIPGDLAEACALVCGDVGTLRRIDMGQVGDRYFVLRVGLGFEADMVEGADRELKDKLGVLAYGLAAVRALARPQTACYSLTLDGRRIQAEGITCLVANTGSVGTLGVSLTPTIDVSDGLLDVVVVSSANVPTLLEVAANALRGTEDHGGALQHWQAREVTVEADPPQRVQVDGEPLDEGPVTARVLPGAIQVVVPRSAAIAQKPPAPAS